MTLQEVSDFLNLSKYQTRLFLKEASIQRVGKNTFKEAVYNTNIIKKFHDALEKRYTDNCLHKYTPKEIIALGCTGHDRALLESKPTELFDRYKHFNGCSYFYSKVEVDTYLASKNNNCELLTLSQIKELVGFKETRQLQRALSECNIKEVKKGYSSFTYYKETDIKEFIDLVEKRYVFNKKNRLSTQQLKELGFKKFNRIELQTYKVEPLDRIGEYAGALAFYDKNEVEEKLRYKELLINAICEKEAREYLGFRNTKKFKMLIEEYNIPAISKGKYETIYYDKSNLESLKIIIDRNYKHNLETKITSSQIKTLGYSDKLIRKLTPIYTKPIDNVYEFSSAITFFNKEQFFYCTELNSSVENYYTSREVIELLNPPKNLIRYMNRCGILPINLPSSNKNYWSKKEIGDFVKRKSDLYKYYDSNYYLTSEVEELLGCNINKFYSICSKIDFPVKPKKIPTEVKFNKFTNIHLVFSKNEIQSILSRINNYRDQQITKKNQSTNTSKSIEVIQIDSNNICEIQSSLETLKHLKEETKIQIIEDIKNYSSSTVYNKNKTVISEKDFIRKLNYSKKQFDENKEKFNLFKLKYGKINYYLLKECSILLKELLMKQNSLLELNYTYSEANTKVSIDTLNKMKEKFPTPSTLRFGQLKKCKVLYPKHVIDNHVELCQYSNVVERNKKELEFTTLPDRIYLETVKELGLHFSDSFKNTEAAWHNFVSNKLLSSNGNLKTIKRLFVRCINVTELLQSSIISKELIEMNTHEINFIFLNNKIPSTYKEILYTFFKHLFLRFPNCKYSISELKNPYAEKSERLANSNSNNQIYSINEFLTLLDYVKDIKLHKERAFCEYSLKNQDSNKGNYESIWLYVMLHLNNGWRSNDFIEKIPRVPISIPVQDYESFKNYNLTLEEATKIIWELKSYLMNAHHNKNGKKAFFFISEELIVPVANAIILCELKAQLTNSNRNNLIDLGNSNELTSSMHDKFFKSFLLKDFKFKSLMANRTFITFVNSILKQKTNRNPLEITKFIRNHTSLDTTNRYVDISEDHLNKISKQLFDKGYFGYTYDYLKQIVLGNSQSTFIDSNEKNLMKTVFGDIYKIENLSTHLNVIEEKRKPLYDFVNDLSKENQQEVLDLINMNQLPAKDDFWQCILGDCLYLDRKCDSCPFAISHFYVLSKVVHNLNILIPQLEQIKHISYRGEKVRLVNLLYKNLSIVSAAKKQFGEDVLTSFLGKNYRDFLNKIHSLDDINENLTIGGA